MERYAEASTFDVSAIREADSEKMATDPERQSCPNPSSLKS